MDLLVFVAFLAATFAAGRIGERRHLAALDERERRLRPLLSTTCETAPGVPEAADGALVVGSVVVSLDYARRIAAALRNLVGGPVPGFEAVLARGRREALLRMREAAAAAGYRQVVAVRLETACLASSTQGGKGTAGIEVLAVGTGIRPRR